MNLTRRDFLHASLMAGGLVLVPKFGRIFRQLWEPKPDRYTAYSLKIGDGPWQFHEWIRVGGVWKPADPKATYSHPSPVVIFEAPAPDWGAVVTLGQPHVCVSDWSEYRA